MKKELKAFNSQIIKADLIAVAEHATKLPGLLSLMSLFQKRYQRSKNYRQERGGVISNHTYLYLILLITKSLYVDLKPVTVVTKKLS